MTAPLDTTGPAAPPRRNGELVFAEPWESRAFGMAVALVDAGVLTWDGFRRALVDRIARAERADLRGEPFAYYRCWLEALECAAAEAGLVSRREMEHRGRELAARAPGHDHP